MKAPQIDRPPDLFLLAFLIAAAEGKGFYEWLKDELTHSCPDEETLLQMLVDVRKGGSDRMVSSRNQLSRQLSNPTPWVSLT